ncbi:CDC37-like protein [Mya arenaria]|uniref:Hsp90 chaperone protein kinase-targeting subunit n=1 Tax=Mya arenaria TaxID=6604 RepID=A0ABY7EE94_MYAAR|nr:CDC37-like protein [Mya arenaria]
MKILSKDISDDEDDTHPNIDTPSLFRWRHQARVERMEEQKKEKETFKSELTSHQQKIQDMKQKLKEAEEKKALEDLDALKKELKEMEQQETEFRRKEDEIKQAQKEYMDAFNDELNGFKERIRTRAKQKIEEAIKEHEEEERQKRLGPGGLDPVEVFESLPDVMKDCFEKKDIEMLKKVVVEMPKEDAEYHIKRCVDSGLWVPGGAEGEGEEGAEEEGAKEEGEGKEKDEIYEEVK